MAEHQPHTEFGEGPDQVSMSRVAQWGGALISVALIIGMAIWVYGIVSRDVSGVPVVRANDGPLRVQPQDPGGQPADHQGFSVNNVVSDGTASPSSEMLVLAPEPQTLEDEDQPLGDLTSSQNEPLVSNALSDDVSEDERVEAVIGLADQLIAEEQSDGDVAAGSEAILLAVLEAAETPDAEGGPTQTPFPKLRPGLVGSTTPAQSTASTSNVREITPEAVPNGSRLVQLGAFNSAEVARSEWDRMSNLFAGYLDDKTRVIQRAESGGKVFYRLRALGFDDIDDARRFCAAFKSRNVDCVPVLVR